MKTKKESLNILENHYRNWADNAINPEHRKYAIKMYNAVLDGNHVEVFEEEGEYRYINQHGRKFKTAKEMAEAYKCSEGNMRENYKRYGIKRIG